MPRTLSEQEFHALEDAILRDAPKGLSEQALDRYVTPRLDGAVAEAENSQAPVSGSAMRRFIGSAAEQLNPLAMAEGAYQAVRHPIDTVGQIGMGMRDQAQQSAEMFQQGRISEGIGHGAAAFIPMLGPAAAKIGEAYGATGDLASAAGGATGLIAPLLVGPAMRAGKATVGIAAKAAPGAAATAADALDAAAADRYANVMSPKGGPNARRFGNIAREVAPDLAKNPEMSAMSRTGLHAKVADGLDAASNALDEAADARGISQLDTKPILNDLLKERQKLVAETVQATQPERATSVRQSPIVDERGQPVTVTERKAVPFGKNVEPAPNAARIATLDRIIAEVKQLGPIANFEALRRIRQAWNGVAKQVYSSAVTDDFLRKQGEAFGAADGSGVIREHLAGKDPGTAAANAQYHLMKNANDVMKAAEEVERARPRVGRKLMARLTGVIAGGHAAGVPGELIGYALGPAVDSAMSSGVTMQLKTARWMSDLAQALRTGNVERAASTVGRLRAIANAAAKESPVAAGRLVIDRLQAAPMGAGPQPATPDTTVQR